MKWINIAEDFIMTRMSPALADTIFKAFERKAFKHSRARSLAINLGSLNTVIKPHTMEWIQTFYRETSYPDVISEGVLARYNMTEPVFEGLRFKEYLEVHLRL